MREGRAECWRIECSSEGVVERGVKGGVGVDGTGAWGVSGRAKG